MRTYAKIFPDGAAYELDASYDRDLVTDLKQLIPASDRTWNRDRKTWTIAGRHKQLIADLCVKYLGIDPVFPVIETSAAQTAILQILYIGRSKERRDGSRGAFGWYKSPTSLLPSWGVYFPEKVLRGFFEPEFDMAERPSGSYYELLGIRKDADLNAIKSGYRRMVKQWHPDVCREADAAEVFRKIQQAFETLCDPKLKARYDVGLRMQASAGSRYQVSGKKPDPDDEWRPPLRCGNILCEYSKLGERITVQRILRWEDIYNNAGQTLCTSWTMGASEPDYVWQ